MLDLEAQELNVIVIIIHASSCGTGHRLLSSKIKAQEINFEKKKMPKKSKNSLIPQIVFYHSNLSNNWSEM